MPKWANLCGMCNNEAIGRGILLLGKATIKVCAKHKRLVVDFKPFEE